MIITKSRKRLLTGLALMFLQSCDRQAEIPEKQLHYEASKLNLVDRYNLYLHVYKSRFPRNPVLANDVAKLGHPARKYVLERAAKSGATEFGAILDVLFAFGTKCSESEYRYLLSEADRISTTSGEFAAFHRSIDGLCKGVLPPGVRGPR